MTSHSPGIEGSLEILFPELPPEALKHLEQILATRGQIHGLVINISPLDHVRDPKARSQMNGDPVANLKTLAESNGNLTQGAEMDIRLVRDTIGTGIAGVRHHLGISLGTKPRLSALKMDHYTGLGRAIHFKKPHVITDIAQIAAAIKDLHRQIIH